MAGRGRCGSWPPQGGKPTDAQGRGRPRPAGAQADASDQLHGEAGADWARDAAGQADWRRGGCGPNRAWKRGRRRQARPGGWGGRSRLGKHGRGRLAARWPQAERGRQALEADGAAGATSCGSGGEGRKGAGESAVRAVAGWSSAEWHGRRPTEAGRRPGQDEATAGVGGGAHSSRGAGVRALGAEPSARGDADGCGWCRQEASRRRGSVRVLADVGVREQGAGGWGGEPDGGGLGARGRGQIAEPDAAVGCWHAGTVQARWADSCVQLGAVVKQSTAAGESCARGTGEREQQRRSRHFLIDVWPLSGCCTRDI